MPASWGHLYNSVLDHQFQDRDQVWNLRCLNSRTVGIHASPHSNIAQCKCTCPSWVVHSSLKVHQSSLRIEFTHLMTKICHLHQSILEESVDRWRAFITQVSFSYHPWKIANQSSQGFICNAFRGGGQQIASPEGCKSYCKASVRQHCFLSAVNV